MGVKLLPKGMAALAPIQIVSDRPTPSLFLVDDDPIVRETWRIAAGRAGLELKTFCSAEDFSADARPLMNKETTILIDVELGVGESGDMLAARLLGEGFTQVWLSTGHSRENFTRLPGLRGVLGKTPPEDFRKVIGC
jgi:hypothetical protein